jgi:WD40 repeat protein
MLLTQFAQKYDLQIQGTPITQLLQDVVEILQLYGIPIRSHALQVYHSAFVTMPSCVLLDTLARDSISESLPRMLSPRATHLSHAARVLMAHISPVEAVAYSPDGTYIVSGSQDRTIWVWSAVTFEQLGRMEGFRDAVNSVVFSPDGARVVAGSDDHTVRIWNVVDQVLLATLGDHQDRVYSVAVSPDGARIISGSQDKTIRVWCAHSFTQLSQLQGYESRVLSVVFSPKGDLILSSCRDTIRVFDSSSLDPLVELTATLPSDPMDQGIFRCAAFSHDGAHILAGTTTGRVRVWSAVAFQELAALDQKLGSADCLSISPDGAFVLSSDWDNGHIHVWDAQSFKEITRFHAHQWGVRSVAFSPDSTRFVSGGMDKAVRVWVTDMFNENPIQSEAPSRQIRSLVFSVDGAHILLRSQDRDHKLGRLSTARVWNINTFEELGQIERVSLFLFSPDGTRAVVHENELLLGVWSLSPFEKISQLDMPDGPGRIESMSYSSEGNRILCGMPGGGIKSLSAITFEELFAFQAHSSSVLDVVFSTNDSRLISRSMADGIRVWDARTLEKLGEIPLHNTSIDCMSVSPKGMHIMAGFPDRTVRIWSTLAFHEILRLPLGRGWKLNHTAFSPDGQSILIAYHSCETQAWTCSKVDSCAFSLPVRLYPILT